MCMLHLKIMHVLIALVCIEPKLQLITTRFSYSLGVRKFLFCTHATYGMGVVGAYSQWSRNKVYCCPFNVGMAFFFVHMEAYRENTIP